MIIITNTRKARRMPLSMSAEHDRGTAFIANEREIRLSRISMYRNLAEHKRPVTIGRVHG